MALSIDVLTDSSPSEVPVASKNIRSKSKFRSLRVAAATVAALTTTGVLPEFAFGDTSTNNAITLSVSGMGMQDSSGNVQMGDLKCADNAVARIEINGGTPGASINTRVAVFSFSDCEGNKIPMSGANLSQPLILDSTQKAKTFDANGHFTTYNPIPGNGEINVCFGSNATPGDKCIDIVHTQDGQLTVDGQTGIPTPTPALTVAVVAGGPSASTSPVSGAEGQIIATSTPSNKDSAVVTATATAVAAPITTATFIPVTPTAVPVDNGGNPAMVGFSPDQVATLNQAININRSFALGNIVIDSDQISSLDRDFSVNTSLILAQAGPISDVMKTVTIREGSTAPAGCLDACAPRGTNDIYIRANIVRGSDQAYINFLAEVINKELNTKAIDRAYAAAQLQFLERAPSCGTLTFVKRAIASGLSLPGAIDAYTNACQVGFGTTS